MKLTFPERLGFKRDAANDFDDDGNYFRMYKYKDVLSFSALHAYGEVFISPRDPKDKNGNLVRLWQDKELNSDKYNGYPDTNFDVKKFAELCEEICVKYDLLPNQSSSDIGKPQFNFNPKSCRYRLKDPIENIPKMIGYYNNGSSLRRVINALKNPVSKDKFIDRYYLARYIKWGSVEDWVDIARDVHGLTVDDLIEIDQLAFIDRHDDVYNIFKYLKRC